MLVPLYTLETSLNLAVLQINDKAILTSVPFFGAGVVVAGAGVVVALDWQSTTDTIASSIKTIKNSLEST